MERTLEIVDISDESELLRLVEDVRASGAPRLLRRGGEDVALLLPMESVAVYPWREPTEEDYEAFRSSAGSWKGHIDVEQFLRDNYESRRRSSRPAVDL